MNLATFQPSELISVKEIIISIETKWVSNVNENNPTGSTSHSNTYSLATSIALQYLSRIHSFFPFCLRLRMRTCSKRSIMGEEEIRPLDMQRQVWEQLIFPWHVSAQRELLLKLKLTFSQCVLSCILWDEEDELVNALERKLSFRIFSHNRSGRSLKDGAFFCLHRLCLLSDGPTGSQVFVLDVADTV